jgi:signal transduction histidine kinase
MEIVFDFTAKAGGPDPEQDRLARLVACLHLYVGHELPNQLVTIQAFARMLQEDHGQSLDEEGRMMLERVASLTQKADVLARRLADLNRLLREPPWGERLSLEEVVREAIAEVKVLGASSAIRYDVQDDLPFVFASRPLLHQVLVQLLRNARRAITEANGIIGVGGQRDPEGVSFWVRDTGRGMTEGDVTLFEPFAAGRFPGAAGPGLGLFLVSQAAARWTGRLRVQSQPGLGSTFTMFLPERPVQENAWTS